MAIPIHKPSREEMLACIARFDEIPHTDKGLPDAEINGYHRTFYNVLGFQQPDGADSYSPIGDAAKPVISHLQPGFGIANVAARPGQGVMMHTHDTNESFVIMSGTWILRWQGDQGDDEVVLNPRDAISFPPGIQRQFICQAAADDEEKGLLLAVIGGDSPAAEYAPEAVERMRAEGVWPDAD